jgi:hypothetical protein
MTELQIRNDAELLLHVASNGMVSVPLCPKERALCREALEGALKLLADTTITRGTFSTAVGKGEVVIRSSQRPAGSLAVFYSSLP